MRLPPPPLAQTTGPASGSAPRGAHGAPGGGCGGARGRRRFGWSSSGLGVALVKTKRKSRSNTGAALIFLSPLSPDL
jgi:hypothetical protein